MTNGVSVPFSSAHKTARLVEAATMARGSEAQREEWDMKMCMCDDEETMAVYHSYKKERDAF